MEHRISAEDDAKIRIASGGLGLKDLAHQLVQSLSPDLDLLPSPAYPEGHKSGRGAGGELRTTLLGFMAGSPMSPDHISAKVGDTGKDVEVLVALRDAKHCEHKKGSDFYMLRNDMDADLGKVIMKWFELYPSFSSASQLALGVLYSKDLWLHVEFLTLMQAFEGFHRATAPASKKKITLRTRLDCARNALAFAIETEHLG
jgi:hypothetical protein